jgi:excisionase family DNA binding protein
MIDETKYKPLEAARIFGIAKSTLYDWVRDQKVSHHRKGGRIYFTPEDIASAYTFVPAKTAA